MSIEGFRQGLALRAIEYLAQKKQDTFDNEFLTARGNEILREGIGKYIAGEQKNSVPSHIITDPSDSLKEEERIMKNAYLKRMTQKGYSEASAIRAFERYNMKANR